MSPLQRLKEQVAGEVQARRDALIRIADQIHAHPEIALQEFESAALLSRTLEDAGFAVERGVAGMETAFVATPASPKKGPTIAFLAEYDALPDLGHACGHNLIGTAAIGAGLAMAVALSSLEGAIQVIGTPAEEADGGKVIMIRAGLFDGIDAAMMFHPSNRNLTRRGSLTSHRVTIRFHGKAAHAASYPDYGVNALDALLLTFHAVNALRQHLREEARIHGIITHGGDVPNVVPVLAEGIFGLRAANLPYAHELIEKVRACAEAGARATGARLEFEVQNRYYDAMLPNPVLADLMEANLSLLGVTVQPPEPRERMGSTDMGNVSQLVPALHPYLAIGPASLVGHSAEFCEAAGSPTGHQAMILAAQAMAMTAVDLLGEPKTLQAARQALHETWQKAAEVSAVGKCQGESTSRFPE